MDDRIADLAGIVAALLTSRIKEARSQATEWGNAAASPPGLETPAETDSCSRSSREGSSGQAARVCWRGAHSSAAACPLGATEQEALARIQGPSGWRSGLENLGCPNQGSAELGCHGTSFSHWQDGLARMWISFPYSGRVPPPSSQRTWV